jgi:hypothetical protein
VVKILFSVAFCCAGVTPEASAEFGFRFERLLKRKDQIGFGSQNLIGFDPFSFLKELLAGKIAEACPAARFKRSAGMGGDLGKRSGIWG